jgi:hypothetical protein
MVRATRYEVGLTQSLADMKVMSLIVAPAGRCGGHVISVTM